MSREEGGELGHLCGLEAMGMAEEEEDESDGRIAVVVGRIRLEVRDHRLPFGHRKSRQDKTGEKKSRIEGGRWEEG